MDYEKKYKDILVRLEEAKNDNDVCDERYCCVINDIIPELNELEDERIREELIKGTKGSEVRLFETVTNDEFVAWLEKQGEKIPANSAKTCKDEQKPAWSEEDEEELFNAVYACLNFYGKDSDTANWLKSLKERMAQ